MQYDDVIANPRWRTIFLRSNICCKLANKVSKRWTSLCSRI